MSIVAIDFETYWDAEVTLRRLTVPEYISHSKFHVHGAGVAVEDPRQPGAIIMQRWMWEWEFRAWAAKQDWSQHEIVCHNTPFDGSILSRVYKIKPRFWYDTVSMGRVCFKHLLPGYKTMNGQQVPMNKSLSLDSLMTFTGMPGKQFDITRTRALLTCHMVQPPDELIPPTWPEVGFELAAYGQKDAADALHLLAAMRPQFSHDELRLIDWTVRQQTEPVLDLDIPLLEEALADQEFDEKELLIEAFGDPDAPEGQGFTHAQAVRELRSDERFADILRAFGVDVDEAGRKTSKRTGKQTWAFAKSDNFMDSLKRHENGTVMALAHARLATKSSLIRTRCQRMIDVGNASNSKLPVSLAYAAAHTRRFGGSGRLNLQNLKRGSAMRRAIKAPPGCTLIIGDLSQIEARFVATFAEQWDLVDQFAAGEDVYSTFASVIFGFLVNKKDHPIERFCGKQGILGLGFGCGGTKFRSMLWVMGGLEKAIEFCQMVVSTYRKKSYPKIPALWRALDRAIPALAAGNTSYPFPIPGARITAPGELTLASGGKLHYPHLHMRLDVQGREEWVFEGDRGGLWTKLWGGFLLENIVQSSARDLVCQAQLRIMDRGIRIALQVHDELVGVVPLAARDAAVRVFTEEMSKAPGYLPRLPVACEVHASLVYDK